MSNKYNQSCLPYYKSGTSRYAVIKKRISRNSRIKVSRIPDRVLYMQKGSKFCSKCKKILPLREFGMDFKLKLFRNTCRKCTSVIQNSSAKRRGVYDEQMKTMNKKRRLVVLLKISPKIQCVRCGCDDIRLIEINHKNGRGTKESGQNNLCHMIMRGFRKTGDLELLCRACNAIHFLEMKYGKLPMKVMWSKKILE